MLPHTSSSDVASAKRGSPQKKQPQKAKGPGNPRKPGNSKVKLSIPNFPSELFQSFSESTSSTGMANQKEVHYQIIDWHDWNSSAENGPVQAYWFDLLQDYLGNNDDYGSSLSRVVGVTVYCLPRASNSQVATTSYVVLAGVPVHVPDTTETVLANATNTIIRPTFNVKWRKVLHYTADQLFGNSEVTPNYGLGRMQCLYSLSCIDPDDGTPLNNPVQIATVIEFAQVLPVKNRVIAAVTTGQQFGQPALPTAKSDTFAMVKPMRLSNFT